MPEPEPIKNNNPAIWDIMVDEMKDRDNLGLYKYGMRLQANNGRDAIQDLKEELLDGIAYLTQLQQEMKTEYWIQILDSNEWIDFHKFKSIDLMKQYFEDNPIKTGKRMIERKTLIQEKEIKP